MRKQKSPAPPRRPTAELAAACGGILLMAAAMVWLTGTAPRQATIGGPFALTDQHGRAVTDRDFRGRYLLVTFGYTHCRDVCPATLTAISAALQKLGPAASAIQPLFISLDPSRDTPEVLGHYVASFSPSLLGLTGSQAAVQQVAREYRVTETVHQAPDGSMDHSAVIYLVAPDGRYLAPLPSDDSGSMLAQRLARYLS